VYVFDRTCDDDAHAMNQRVAACYRWATAHGFCVIDEVIDWPRPTSDGHPTDPQEERSLARAIARCRRDRAGLLVHSPTVLRDHPDAALRLLERAPGPRVITVAEAAPDGPR
jgi:hypothetical protein